MKKLTKFPELITPPIKITPPPPPPRTRLNKDSRLKHLFKGSISCLTLLGIAPMLVIASCENVYYIFRKKKHFLLFAVLSALFVPLLVSCPDGIEPNGVEPIEIVTQELPRSDAEYSKTGLRPDDYRTSIVLFSIKSVNTDNADKYRLVVRDSSANDPDAEAVRSSSAAIVRTVSPTPINVHMGFHMDTTLFDDNTVLGDADDAKVDEARLQPNTAYTLYGILENGGTEVLTLLSFNTDAHPAEDISSSTFLYNFPPDKYTFTINSGEPFLIDGIFLSLQSSIFFKISGLTLTQMSNIAEMALPRSVDHMKGSNLFGDDIYFIPKHLSGKSQLTAVMKNIELKPNSGEQFTIEYESTPNKSTMNFIAE